MAVPDVVTRMRDGEPPATPEEWKELAGILTQCARFLALTSLELDYVGHALDLTEPLLIILTEAADPETKARMQEVVDKHEQESHRLPLPEVQEEDGWGSGDRPIEPGGGELMP